MPKRIPVQTVRVYRDGKQVTPKIGEPFDFNDAELKDITRMNPNAVTKIGQVDLSDEDDIAPEKPAKALTKAQQAAKDKEDAAEAERLAKEQASVTGNGSAEQDQL